MTFQYHCRGCGKEEDITISLEDLRKYLALSNENFFKALCLFVSQQRHRSCPEADIGVKSKCVQFKHF